MNPDLANGVFKINPYVPYDPSVAPLYAAYCGHPAAGGVQPFVYTDWREEELSWHKTCYIHAGLNPFPEMRVKGPDAKNFLSASLTNDFDNFEVGQIKHAIMVTEQGFLGADGLVIRLAEDEFETTCLNPYLEYRHMTGSYDCTVEDLTGDTFFYQLGGPKSIDIVEAATGTDLRHIKFLRIDYAQIDGCDVRIQRIGMAGSLAYEVHGDFKDAQTVYNALIEAGKDFGLVRLGLQAYWNTHTENGFPQASIHFPYAIETDKGYYDHAMKNAPVLAQLAACNAKLSGSLGTDPTLRYVNPIELGWERAVSFDHDFVGKEALQKIIESDHRKVVTLEWDTEDVLDIWRSEFVPGEEPYCKMDGPVDYNEAGQFMYQADKVLSSDGAFIGTSTGRMHSWYYRKMISLALLEPQYAAEGTEVVVLWGDEGTRQKEIRATVARYPYMNENRNENVDVTK